MREIVLTQGKVALVDDEDFELVSQWKWHAHFDGLHWYARRGQRVNGKVVITRMRRQLLCPQEGKDIDHISGDTLDNRRCNLREATKAENVRNQPPRCNRTSGVQHKGVYVEGDSFRAQIRYHSVLISLGTWSTEFDAACAYDAAAEWLFGEFSNTNF